MNEEETKHVALLQAHHANQMELAQHPQNFAAEIMSFVDDPEIVAAAKALSNVTGEAVPSIVNRVLAVKAAEYLAGQKDKAKMDPAPVLEVNPAVADFRKKMGAGK